MKRTNLFRLITFVVTFALANSAIAAGGMKSARPAIFNEETAMLAVYGEYSAQHKGTLIPVEYTGAWDMANAEVLATPIMVGTYVENGVEKGVIAVQRQMIVQGEAAWSHGSKAEIAVYVFAYNGKEYVFEKGKRDVTEAGAWGSAPGGRLIRIGRDKYGLLFEGGYTTQGEAQDYAFIIGLSDGTPAVAVEFDTRGSYNAEESDKSWQWEGEFEFLQDDTSDYFPLRLTSEGTVDVNDKLRSLHKVQHYVYSHGKYRTTSEARYRKLQAVNASQIDVEGAEMREKSMATIPQKLLRR